MEPPTIYKIKFELFKISDDMYRAQIEAGTTPKFDKIGEKEMMYDRDMPLGELLINNYGGRNTRSEVDKFLIAYKRENFVSCSRDCYLVTNKYNGSNEKIKYSDESVAWKTPVLLPITNLTGNSNNASIVSYRTTISQAKPYSNWTNAAFQRGENLFYHNWSYAKDGFIWIKIYLICGETPDPPRRRQFGNMNDIANYENDLEEESGIIIGEPQLEPEAESDDTEDEEGYNPARARRVARDRRRAHNELAERALRGDLQRYSSFRSRNRRRRQPYCFRGGKSKKNIKNIKNIKNKKRTKNQKKSKKHRTR